MEANKFFSWEANIERVLQTAKQEEILTFVGKNVDGWFGWVKDKRKKWHDMQVFDWSPHLDAQGLAQLCVLYQTGAQSELYEFEQASGQGGIDWFWQQALYKGWGVEVFMWLKEKPEERLFLWPQFGTAPENAFVMLCMIQDDTLAAAHTICEVYAQYPSIRCDPHLLVILLETGVSLNEIPLIHTCMLLLHENHKEKLGSQLSHSCPWYEDMEFLKKTGSEVGLPEKFTDSLEDYWEMRSPLTWSRMQEYWLKEAVRVKEESLKNISGTKEERQYVRSENVSQESVRL